MSQAAFDARARRNGRHAYMSFSAALAVAAVCQWSEHSGIWIHTNSGIDRRFVDLGLSGHGVWFSYHAASISQAELRSLAACRSSYYEWGKRTRGIDFVHDKDALCSVKLTSPWLPRYDRQVLPPVTIMLANAPTVLSGFSVIEAVIPLWIPILFFCGTGAAFFLRSRTAAKQSQKCSRARSGCRDDS